MTDIHQTAIVDENAKIGQNVSIGPYSAIGPEVELGDGIELISHVVISGRTTIGANTRVFPFASIGHQPQDQKYNGEASSLEIGCNNVIREYVTMNPGTEGGGMVTRIGNNCLFMISAHVAHDCQLGDHIVMSNVATLAGHVTVEDCAIIGGLAAVHQFCRIGTMSIIGGCSKVVQDIPPYMMADGNPAATRALNKEGLKRNDVSEETQTALKQAHRILFRENLTFTKGVEKARAEIPASDEIEHLLTFIETSQRGIAR